jgi:hypothetical protein
VATKDSSTGKIFYTVEKALRGAAPHKFKNHPGAICLAENPPPESNTGLKRTSKDSNKKKFCMETSSKLKINLIRKSPQSRETILASGGKDAHHPCIFYTM